MRRVTAGLVVVAVGLGGCATLRRGTSDEVAVISDPPGASVTTTLGVGCPSTPCTLNVARNAVFTVTVAEAGYASRSVPVETRISSVGAAVATENVVTAGLGLAVDAATGAALEHVPNPVSVTLARLSHSAAKPGRTRPAHHPAT